jgi:hypothetical protein
MLLVLILGSLSPIAVDYHSSSRQKLPFVCRFEDATASKPKQNLTQFGKAKDSEKQKDE